ncbi:MAG: macrolide transport system ATP-binding/permease protein [Planctomycetota bacterium]|jgi:macrolide transport system ATP-binding/permease protein
MTHEAVIFHDVDFSYESMSTVLLEHIDFHLPSGWTGMVGPNGAGKTTLLKLAIGDYIPKAGRIEHPEGVVYCAQRTDAPPPALQGLLDADDGSAWELKGRLGLEWDWFQRWQTLSHGERKRAQIASALWLEPQVLAVDEPTNHIDVDARQMLVGALRAYRGIGLLVSHDRELLDGLCRQCVFVDPPSAELRPGGYSQGNEQGQRQDEETRHLAVQVKKEHERLRRETIRRRDEATRSDKRVSKRGLGKDNAERGKRNLARVTGRDAVSGKLLRQLDGRLQQSEDRVAQVQVKKQYELGIWMQDGRSKRDVLLRAEAGAVELGHGRQLRFPDLELKPDARVALQGVNGGGKSTLLKHLLPQFNVPADRLVYMPQEIAAAESAQILDAARALPRDELGRMMAVVSRLGSRPTRLLESVEPSPGEIRKVLLAAGIAQVPHIIVLDEPTNHLDLPSIECLEQALAACPCALLLISHDASFLQKLTQMHWQIEPLEEGDVLQLKVSLDWGIGVA